MLAASWVLALTQIQFRYSFDPFTLITYPVWTHLLRVWVACALLLLAACVLVGKLIYDRRGWASVYPVLSALNLIVCSGAVVPFVFLPTGVEYQHMAAALTCIGFSAYLFAEGVSRLMAARGNRTARFRIGPRAAWSFVWVGTIVFAVYFSALALYRYWAFIPKAHDLSFENQAVWAAYHASPMWSTIIFDGSYLQNHTPYIYYLIAIPYALFPRPEFLLVLQAVMLAAGAPILFLFLRKLGLDDTVAALFSVLYLLHPALHGMALFDFHSIVLALPFMFLMWYGLASGRAWCVAVGCIFVLATREDAALIVIATGLFGLLSRQRVRTSIFILLLGAVFFFVNTGVVMPHYGPHLYPGDFGRFSHILAPIGSYPFAVRLIVTMLANPLLVVGRILDPTRIMYLVLMSFPLAGLCWRGGWKGYILLAPGLLLTVLSDIRTHYQVGFQYSTLLLGGIFYIAALGWLRIRSRAGEGPFLRKHFLWMIFAAVSVGYLYGSFISKTYKLHYAFHPPRGSVPGVPYGPMVWCSEDWPRPSPYWGFAREAYSLVPPDASIITASIITGAEVDFQPMFSSRREVFAIGLNEGEPGAADYALIPRSFAPDYAPPESYEEILSYRDFALYRRKVAGVAARGDPEPRTTNESPASGSPSTQTERNNRG